jgi:hypothetical protein
VLNRCLRQFILNCSSQRSSKDHLLLHPFLRLRKNQTYRLPSCRIPQVHARVIVNFCHMYWFSRIYHCEADRPHVTIQTFLHNKLNIIGSRGYIAKKCRPSVLLFRVEVVLQQCDRSTNNLTEKLHKGTNSKYQ